MVNSRAYVRNVAMINVQLGVRCCAKNRCGQYRNAYSYGINTYLAGWGIVDAQVSMRMSFALYAICEYCLMRVAVSA